MLTDAIKKQLWAIKKLIKDNKKQITNSSRTKERGKKKEIPGKALYNY